MMSSRGVLALVLLAVTVCNLSLAGATSSSFQSVMEVGADEAHASTAVNQVEAALANESKDSSPLAVATQMATLLIKYGSMILAGLSVMAAVITGVGALGTNRVLKDAKEIDMTLREIRRIKDGIEGEANRIAEQSQVLVEKLQEPYLNGALADLAIEGDDAESARKRYAATTILHGVGQLHHTHFLLVALDKKYETEENKRMIRAAIEAIATRHTSRRT